MSTSESTERRNRRLIDRLERAARGLESAEGPRALRPIGPERLRRLREAIRNGTYPDDAVVEEGLARMFLGSTGGRPDA